MQRRVAFYMDVNNNVGIRLFHPDAEHEVTRTYYINIRKAGKEEDAAKALTIMRGAPGGDATAAAAGDAGDDAADAHADGAGAGSSAGAGAGAGAGGVGSKRGRSAVAAADEAATDEAEPSGGAGAAPAAARPRTGDSGGS